MASFTDVSRGPYEASSLAKWFHSAPHKDFDLQDTTTIFSPDDASYREALYVLAICIASFGAFLFLLILLFYTCCFCIYGRSMQRRQNQSSCCSNSCLQFQIFILALICCGAVVVGFIYNRRTSDGVDQFRNSVDSIQDDINQASLLGNKMYVKLSQAEDLIRNLEPFSHTAYNLVEKLIYNLSYVNHLLPQDVVNKSSNAGDKIHKYDNYRWLGTVILLSWCILLCVFLFWIACQLNACILVMTTVFCLLTILFTWSVTGADFGIATGIGDFCVHPKQAVKKMGNDAKTSAVISYYMDCKGAKHDPFSNGLGELNHDLPILISIIRKLSVDPPYVPMKKEILDDLNYIQDNLGLYEDGFTCDKIHNEYMNAMDGLCGKALNALGIVILAVFVVAVFSGLLTCCTCPLWRNRHPGPRAFNDIRSPPDTVGNNVLWWPHDIDANSDETFHRRHAEPNERSPLINQRLPDPEPTAGNHGNVNFINVNYNNPPSKGDERLSTSRHSF